MESHYEVSVVFPCLNEEKTLGPCIRQAFEAMNSAGICGEVVVADNGSTDRSVQIAMSEGAHVIHVPARGYGNALYYGFNAARGRYIVFLDADLSYDCAHIPRFVEKLREGADLVMGSRFKGTIHRGAMPRLHRYLGTPVLTGVANLFFGCGITDTNCGMRGLSRLAFQQLGLRAGGMEFASEMVVKAALLKMNIVEIPTDLRPDGRDRAPHLRSFQDGWRHLRFMLLFAPNWLFVIPGLVLTGLGTLVILLMLLNLCPYAGVWTSLAAVATTVLGIQTCLLGLATRGFAQLKRLKAGRSALDRLMMRMTLEKGIGVGGLLSVAGFVILGMAGWRIHEFMSQPDYVLGMFDAASTKLAMLGTTLLVTGVQIVFSSFFLGLFGIEPISREKAERMPAGSSLSLDLGGKEYEQERVHDLMMVH